MIVVSDTTAISNLLTVGQADLLPELFGRVLVPPAVFAELLAWHDALPPWLEVVTVTDVTRVERYRRSVHAGEAEAISLCLEVSPDWLLMDDADGRRLAKEEGAPVLGLMECCSCWVWLGCRTPHPVGSGSYALNAPFDFLRQTTLRSAMSMIGNSLRLPESRLIDLLADPESLGDLLELGGSGLAAECYFDTDKAWHLIHFLLTGDVGGGEPPLCNAILGGREVSDEDVGYGSARYLAPEDVREVATALDLISPDALWSRFDAAAVHAAGVYPDGWEGTAEDRDYILGHFTVLKDFFAKAAAEQAAVIHWLG